MTGLEPLLQRAWSRWHLRGRSATAVRCTTAPGWELRMTRRYKLSMLLIFLGFTALYAFAFFITPVFEDAPAWKRLGIQIASAVIWAITVIGVVGAFVERVIVNEVGVTAISAFGRRKTLSWSGLVGAELGEEGFRLVGHRQEKLSVNLYLDGLPILFSYIEKHAPIPELFALRVLAERAPAVQAQASQA